MGNCREWGNKRGCLFSSRKSLMYSMDSRDEDQTPGEQAEEEGLEKGHWHRVRRFGFEVHCSTCHKVEVLMASAHRGDVARTKWHMA